MKFIIMSVEINFFLYKFSHQSQFTVKLRMFIFASLALMGWRGCAAVKWRWYFLKTNGRSCSPSSRPSSAARPPPRPTCPSCSSGTGSWRGPGSRSRPWTGSRGSWAGPAWAGGSSPWAWATPPGRLTRRADSSWIEFVGSVTSRHPEKPFSPNLATQKDQKHPSFSPRCFFFNLIRGFQKHPIVSTYLIKEHLDVKKRHLSILKSWSPCLLELGAHQKIQLAHPKSLNKVPTCVVTWCAHTRCVPFNMCTLYTCSQENKQMYPQTQVYFLLHIPITCVPKNWDCVVRKCPALLTVTV